MNPVRVSIENMIIPTYEAAPYEDLPMFAFNRIHQGTTGNPFPHRIINKVRRDSKVDKAYTAVHLENEYLDLIILPELGGRIFAAKDKTNGYDFFYRQHVIKPALIGIYGLWISGGVEFNWARHHRPSTFMPSDYVVERESGGGVTVWLSEHDPLFRMKGMAGIAIYPGRSIIETKMKIYNRTPLPHAFHWWENAAAPAGKDYQVFFPPDVTYVNYHYRKAAGAYPVMDAYFHTQDNRGGNDIRFHGNTESSTSYFSGVSKYDFFGGYDHGKKAGVIHYASHHTSPGKKMFTWGYQNRGKAWENALTDSDGPYAELMASSYGDNQPDFAWIEPWELKEFSQSWYPYKIIGEPRIAGGHGAIRYEREGDNLAVHIYANENFPRSSLEIRGPSGPGAKKILYLEAAAAQKVLFPSLGSMVRDGLTLTWRQETGEILLAYTQETAEPYVPEPIKDMPGPDAFDKAADCCAAGLHIDQYYDPAIEPPAYWLKGLSIDPGHSGCLTNLGRWYISRQDYAEAGKYLRKAAESLTRYNLNPRDSEALYLLGLVLMKQKKNGEALEILRKACWSAAQIIPASCAAAAIYSSTGSYGEGETWLRRLIRLHGENQRAAGMLITLLRKQGKAHEAADLALKRLREDPLDLHVLNELRLLGESAPAEERFRYRRDETGLDLAGDYADMGLWEDGLELINWIGERQELSCLMFYMAGYMRSMMGNAEAAKACYEKAGKAPLGMRFPSLPYEAEALEDAVSLAPGNARAREYLGILLYGQRRKTGQAIAQWKEAGKLDPASIQALRNLAVGLFSRDNTDPEALSLLDEALKQKPRDLQLIYERNVVATLQGVPPEERRAFFDGLAVPPVSWDEIYLQEIRLYNRMGLHDKALKQLLGHTFIPAEGGEAAVGEEYGNTLEAMAWKAFNMGKTEEALKDFTLAINSPPTLGGGMRHAACLSPYKWGQAQCLFRLGRDTEAKEALLWISALPVDYFARSLMPGYLYFRGMALIGLGQAGQIEEGRKCLEDLKRNAEDGLKQKDYGFFSTASAYDSYIRDPGVQRKIHFGVLLALALSGLGEKQKALEEAAKVLELDPENEQAALVKLRGYLPPA
jgi:tetratricopeptide (TPR) repeat protein